jgi:hypothetical protein
MSVLARLSCLVVLLAVPEVVLAAAPPPAPPLPEEFEFGWDGGPIIVPVKIKGKKYPFVVDTGCSISVFDASLRSLLGKPVRWDSTMTANGERVVAVFKPPIAHVGRQPLPRDGVVAVHDVFRELRNKHGVKVWGCLGMDFLKKYAVRIDFDKGRLALLRSAVGTGGHRLRLAVDRQGPYVAVYMERGKEVEWFLVDTGKFGYGSGKLWGTTYRSLEEAGKLRTVDWGRTLTANGVTEQNIGRLAWLKLGPFEHTGLFFSQGVQGGEPVLGLGYWARYQVTFDFPGKAVYLRKGRHYADPDVLDGSGLMILLKGGRAMVEDVKERSPAAKANIRKGDEIVSIASRKAAGSNLFVLRKLLCGEGRTVRLIVRRGEEKREVSLRLAYAWRADKTKR